MRQPIPSVSFDFHAYHYGDLPVSRSTSTLASRMVLLDRHARFVVAGFGWRVNPWPMNTALVFASRTAKDEIRRPHFHRMHSVMTALCADCVSLAVAAEVRTAVRDDANVLRGPPVGENWHLTCRPIQIDRFTTRTNQLGATPRTKLVSLSRITAVRAGIALILASRISHFWSSRFLLLMNRRTDTVPLR